jgi:hypothetical protein
MELRTSGFLQLIEHIAGYNAAKNWVRFHIPAVPQLIVKECKFANFAVE